MAKREKFVSAIDIFIDFPKCNLEHVKNTHTKAYIFEKVLMLAFEGCYIHNLA